MDISEFSKICEKAHMRQENKFRHRGHDVYIADGMAICKEFGNRMAYRTIVAIGGNKRSKGRMDVMQPLFFDKDLVINKRKEHRINKAIEHSYSLVDALIKAEKQGAGKTSHH